MQEVSRDIHDNIALGLTLSKLHLHTLNYEEPPRFQDKIELSIQLIEEAIHNLSDISKSLNADVIRQYGLIKAVESEIDHLRQTGLFTIHFDVTGDAVRLEPRKEIVLFRIIQEAFNNIIKHSGADTIEIVFSYHDSQIEISVSDNGNGFDTNDQKIQKGSGLNNIRQRIMMINGHCQISGNAGTGSIIKVMVPVQTSDEIRTTYHG
jgi:signal transduction histidine kinase